jgi:hypothetical protein
MVEFQADESVIPPAPSKSVEDLASLLSALCGQRISHKDLSRAAQDGIAGVLSRIEEKNTEKVFLSYEEFNELLLLFNQYRIERSFFEFFFLHPTTSGLPDEGNGGDSICFDDLANGVARFLGFAMLCFGNFRFAYRKLSKEADPARFTRKLEPWNLDSKKKEKEIRQRKDPLLKLVGSSDFIEKKNTWYLGYLTTELLNNDAALARCIVGKAAHTTLEQAVEGQPPVVASKVKDMWDSLTDKEVDTFKSQVQDLGKSISDLIGQAKSEREKGIRNSVKYLTWDYLDVYVATSMRQQWEFQETHDFVGKVFGSHLKDLPLRWFDPTQSYEESVLDKGLLEGLMLKRADCTIYMAQELDTLGKDSELAATLAQGKPVIAFVRTVNLAEEVEKLRERPVRYFRQRILNLMADGFFDKTDNRRKMREGATEVGITLTDDQIKQEPKKLLEFVDSFEGSRKFRLIGREEEDFRKEHADQFDFLIRFLCAVERVAADNRADTMKAKHPLALQVNLASGVANGVLVARSPEECAYLVRGIVTRSLKFTIEKLQDGRGQTLGIVLRESKTKSVFRFVTSNECLTNSFWNFYLQKDRLSN